MRTLLACLVLAACSPTPPPAAYPMPVVAVNPNAHPNLAAAESLVNQAFAKLIDAQNANDRQLGGHAERAKQLLNEALSEIVAAAQAADARRM
jgi:hypothetical protein